MRTATRRFITQPVLRSLDHSAAAEMFGIPFHRASMGTAKNTEFLEVP
jgi:hypothetical protein